MRLIDADALIDSMGLANAVKWGNKDGYQQDNSYSTLMRYEIKDDIDAQPTIDAVPLDRLCEWLAERYEPPYALIDIDKLRRPIDFRQQKEIWMVALTKWMEEQDEAD